MTVDSASAMTEAQQAAVRPADQFFADIVERIGGQAGVRAVFGSPVVRDDLTIVPVARVRWAFGGGAGSAGKAEAEEGLASGSGGGGGVSADPVGYVEIGPEGARFSPIASPYPSPVFLVALGVAATIVLRGLARVVRG